MEIGSSSRALVAFASALASADLSHHLLDRVCDAARIALGADGSALSLDLPAGGRTTVCALGTASERFEYLQDLVAEGPSRDAASSGEIIAATIGGSDFDRWPHLSQVAATAGVRGTYWAIPLRPGDVPFGVLTLHREAGSVDDDVASMRFVGDAVAHAILQDPRWGRADDGVNGPWTERVQIHQATGMVVAQLSVTTTDALSVLRAHAFANNLELSDVALDVLTRRVDFTDHAGGG